MLVVSDHTMTLIRNDIIQWSNQQFAILKPTFRLLRQHLVQAPLFRVLGTLASSNSNVASIWNALESCYVS
jgi:hypothetical protein